ncbi:MAG TPA: hypothetical protein VEA69_24750 [Tepidisphaeraceae bacterium]|nr:hypothetical protein [Tepidisphaeraceae bacterium]
MGRFGGTGSIDPGDGGPVSVATAGVVVLPGPDGVGMVLVGCPVCRAGVERLPPGARFCATCGAKLPPRDDQGVLETPAAGSVWVGVYEGLRTELRDAMSASTQVVRGYAQALERLGWRYENGWGVARNRGEAERCYDKAGRLKGRGD